MQQDSRVLIIITKANWGGAQRHVFDLALGLHKRGHHVGVAFGEGTVLGPKLLQEGIRCVPLHYAARNISKQDWSLFKELLALIRKEQPEVLHLHSSKMGILGTVAGRLARVPRIIFTAHGWASDEERPYYERAIITLLHWLTILLSHHTICVSEHTRRTFSSWPFVQNKMTVIYNGVGEEQLLSQSEARSELIKIAPSLAKYHDINTIWIGTIAELHKNKGVDRIVEALSLIPHVSTPLIVIGEGEERQHLEELIRTHGLADRVVLTGAIPNAARLLPAFNLFTLTSRKEGLPYVLLEAGRAGVPVLASEVGGIPEIIQTMKTGLLIDASDPRNIAAALSLMLADPEKTASFTKRFKQKVSEEFSTTSMLSEIERVYRMVY